MKKNNKRDQAMNNEKTEFVKFQYRGFEGVDYIGRFEAIVSGSGWKEIHDKGYIAAKPASGNLPDTLILDYQPTRTKLCPIEKQSHELVKRTVGDINLAIKWDTMLSTSRILITRKEKDIIVTLYLPESCHELDAYNLSGITTTANMVFSGILERMLSCGIGLVNVNSSLGTVRVSEDF